MQLPDFAILHNELKNGNPNEILAKVEIDLKENLDIENVRQYFYDFLDYIIKFGSEELQAPIREIIRGL